GLGNMTNASATLTATQGTFSAAIVGQHIIVKGAAAGGADLYTTVSAFTDSTHVTLSASAGTTVTGVQWVIDESTQTYYTPNSGTFQLDEASATPAAASIKAFGATITNNLQSIDLSSSILPNDLFPGDQTVEGTATIVPADFSDFRKILTGSGAGT